MAVKMIKLGKFAVCVENLALWQRLDPVIRGRLATMLSQKGVLVFKRQALCESELVAFSRNFGHLEKIVRADWKSENQPEIIQISNMRDNQGKSIGGLGSGELDWHCDQSYVRVPATGSALYMVEMPKEPPRTYWANLQLAYQGLPTSIKQKIDGLEVIYDYCVRQSKYDDEPKMSAELRNKTPPVIHPLVNIHPVTGLKSLYLDPSTASQILGWSKIRSDELFKELVNHAETEEFVYCHHWNIGDVVLWDNGFLMHRRDAFDSASNRLLKRTTIRLPSNLHIVPEGRLET